MNSKKIRSVTEAILNGADIRKSLAQGSRKGVKESYAYVDVDTSDSLDDIYRDIHISLGQYGVKDREEWRAAFTVGALAYKAVEEFQKIFDSMSAKGLPLLGDPSVEYVYVETYVNDGEFRGTFTVTPGFVNSGDFADWGLTEEEVDTGLTVKEAIARNPKFKAKWETFISTIKTLVESTFSKYNASLNFIDLDNEFVLNAEVAAWWDGYDTVPKVDVRIPAKNAPSSVKKIVDQWMTECVEDGQFDEDE